MNILPSPEAPRGLDISSKRWSGVPTPSESAVRIPGDDTSIRHTWPSTIWAAIVSAANATNTFRALPPSSSSTTVSRTTLHLVNESTGSPIAIFPTRSLRIVRSPQSSDFDWADVAGETSAELEDKESLPCCGCSDPLHATEAISPTASVRLCRELLTAECDSSISTERCRTPQGSRSERSCPIPAVSSG